MPSASCLSRHPQKILSRWCHRLAEILSWLSWRHRPSGGCGCDTDHGVVAESVVLGQVHAQLGDPAVVRIPGSIWVAKIAH